MHPEQVVDAQVDLLTRLKNDTVFQEVFMRTVGTQSSVSANPGLRAGQAMLTATTNHVEGAYAFRVSAEMCELVMRAADLLDESDLVDFNMPPTGCGMVRFDKGLPITDARGEIMGMHWMTWGPATFDFGGGPKRPGLMLTGWNDMFADPDSAARRILAEAPRKFLGALGRWSVIGVNLMRHGDGVGPAMVDLPDHTAKMIEEEGYTPHAYTNVDRYALALWLLLDQTITDVSEQYVRKSSTKRARRMNIPGRVSVVQLRRVAHAPSDEPGSVEWQHRWIVRGHWRWQPCGTGRAERRRVWINPFVKGPDDKPLIQSEKVYNFHR